MPDKEGGGEVYQKYHQRSMVICSLAVRQRRRDEVVETVTPHRQYLFVEGAYVLDLNTLTRKIDGTLLYKTGKDLTETPTMLHC